jgi:negative regulator of sigma E activity
MFDWFRLDCVRYRARLEDYLMEEGGVPQSDTDLATHLRHCTQCQQALEDARLAGALLRRAGGPSMEASDAFVTRVMASIREEVSRRVAPENFWRPLEQLASRFAMVATVALILLTAYLGKVLIPSANTTATASDQETTVTLPANPNMPGVSPIMPEPPAQPSNPDEVLMSLAERDSAF